MINVLESSLAWTLGEVIVNSGIGSHTPCFSSDSVSGDFGSNPCSNHSSRCYKVRILYIVYCSTPERKYGKSKADLENTVIKVADEYAGSYEHELSPLSHLHVL
jgi:hypothetical protein